MVLLNESCTAKILTYLRDSIHSDPESGLLYWVSRVSYGEEYEEGLVGPISPRVIEKLRRAKEFYGDVLAEICLSV